MQGGRRGLTDSGGPGENIQGGRGRDRGGGSSAAMNSYEGDFGGGMRPGPSGPPGPLMVQTEMRRGGPGGPRGPA